MCGTCGCDPGQTRIGGRPLAVPAPEAAVSYRPIEAMPSACGADHGDASRRVRIEQDLLADNDALALRNRRRFDARGIRAVNLMSSPGSGKTTLLVETLVRLRGRLPVNVIEGDQETSFDAERIRATGAPALQINTGKGCHLDARMISAAVDALAPPPRSLLLIENVGNLVCPAGFDLGEHERVVVLSVTEGEDKPLKYPEMFHRATLVVLNKVDLLPYVRFDVARCLDFIRRLNAAAPVLHVSATRGDGMAAWIGALTAGLDAPVDAPDSRREPA